MSSKIKVRKQNKPRNLVVRDMILNTKGGAHTDKRNRRGKQDKAWKNENWE